MSDEQEDGCPRCGGATDPEWFCAQEIAAHVDAGHHLDPDGRPDPDGLLFLAPWGGRLRRDNWNVQALKPAVKAAGIEWLTFHGLRHFYASALIRANHAPAIVAARLGNTPQMVHQTYSHLWPDDDDRTRQAIDDVFAPQFMSPVQTTSDSSRT
jgi:integrase